MRRLAASRIWSRVAAPLALFVSASICGIAPPTGTPHLEILYQTVGKRLNHTSRSVNAPLWHQLIQILGKPEAGEIPCAGRRIGVIGRPVVAEETVPRPGIHLDLERLLEPPQRVLHPAHLVHRDHAVRLAEEAEHGTLDAGGVVERGGRSVDGDAAAIEDNGNLDGGGMPARREKGDAPAHTEAHDPDPIAA